MSDYLWDKSGSPDPEVERLEELLGRYRGEPLPFRWPDQTRVTAMPRRPFVTRLIGVAAGIAVIVSAALLLRLQARPGWQVTRLDGAPAVDSRPVAQSGWLADGGWLETGARGRVRLTSRIGRVDVEPNSRLRLVASKVTEQRMALMRGTIHAMILAPPKLFRVTTPSAEVVDLGCAYTLEVDDAGNGSVRVAAGWVAFQNGARESFIPAGAACSMRRYRGPGTPYYLDASDAFIEALGRFDFGGDAGALETVLREARKRDALSLWHLLVRAEPGLRDRVYDRLATLVPPPSGVSRDAALRLDRKAIDLWWDELGLGDTTWWRLWMSDWPSRGK